MQRTHYLSRLQALCEAAIRTRVFLVVGENLLSVVSTGLDGLLIQIKQSKLTL